MSLTAGVWTEELLSERDETCVEVRNCGWWLWLQVFGKNGSIVSSVYELEMALGIRLSIHLNRKDINIPVRVSNSHVLLQLSFIWCYLLLCVFSSLLWCSVTFSAIIMVHIPIIPRFVYNSVRLKILSEVDPAISLVRFSHEGMLSTQCIRHLS